MVINSLEIKDKTNNDLDVNSLKITKKKNKNWC